MKPKVVLLAPTGLVVWGIPDSQFEIMWAGPGSHLLFGYPRRPGGLATPIHHPSADGVYMTRKEAEAAVAAFIADPEETNRD